MQNMPAMLAYTLRASVNQGNPPLLIVGQGTQTTQFTPAQPQDDSYWFIFLDSNNPTNKVADFLIPGQNNTSIPSGIDAYMSNPQYIFALATQFLSMLHVPQGDFFDYLMSYGAGRELQRIEQLNSTLGCGAIGRPIYLLTGQGGPRGGNNVPPPSYEKGSIDATQYITMSLMPGPNGQPPYSICDCYTYVTRAAGA
jgi:hypothetical protein